MTEIILNTMLIMLYISMVLITLCLGSFSINRFCAYMTDYWAIYDNTTPNTIICREDEHGAYFWGSDKYTRYVLHCLMEDINRRKPGIAQRARFKGIYTYNYDGLVKEIYAIILTDERFKLVTAPGHINNI